MSTTASPGPGWRSIDYALDTLPRGDVPPLAFTVRTRCDPLAPSRIDNVAVFVRGGDAPHFHFVTYGLTELYGKESPDERTSGFGFELTFRLARAPHETTPPKWPLALLDGLARYVVGHGQLLRPGDGMEEIPAALPDPASEVRSLAFTPDPELPGRATPHGRMQFLQVVGVTSDEIRASRRWRMDGLLGVMQRNNPLLVTDLARGSILRDPWAAAEVDRGAREDGSSTGALAADRLGWSDRGATLRVKVDSGSARTLAEVLPGRLPRGRSLSIETTGRARVVALASGRRLGWKANGHVVEVSLPEAAVAELARALRPDLGVYSVPAAPGLSFEVVAPLAVQERTPDFAAVDSLEKAVELYEEGRLDRIAVGPAIFGGNEDDPRNQLYVPFGVRRVKDHVDGIVRKAILEGSVRRYRVDPTFAGKSLVPTSLDVHALDPGHFHATIDVWGEGVARPGVRA